MPNAFDRSSEMPRKIYAGEEYVWANEALIADYPIDTHSFEVSFQAYGGGERVVIASVDLDGAPVFTLTAAQTKALGAGRIAWSLTVIRSSDSAKRMIEEGEIAAAPKPGEGGDLRSQAERDYEAVTAVIEGRITKDVAAYSIDGRSVTRIPLNELEARRRSLVRQINRERGAARGRSHKAWS